ncbi:putative methanogenesis marker protein 14 [Methanocalculus alkaliphilus]|uniref:methanogenesis marker 14 protein n=1 Tax=Methanocalculus alkaliphilus TaxID=768730 RepID=UPI0020A0BFC4|nr:methanogenesis marker 14 protein [Methanocalculus alkaliphilus]MCP1715095.1 putative methanogenesis marker protein 14 [Methanocalculus alkaliphilus]
MCAGFLKRFFGKKPHIVHSPPPPSITHGAGMQMPEYKNKPYFIVASIEMGNTTTKCILTGTSLETGSCYVINKTVSMSRDVRPPKPGEEIFGATLDGTKLTRESVTELVRDTLIKCHKEANLSIKDDLDFVVRSTGVVAAMESPEQIGDFIIALANGCLEAGVPPRKMTPPMSIDNLPKKLREASYADRLVFTGAVAGVLPPVGSTGVEMVANEMEGELAMAGIKEGAKWTPVDFRNPCLSLDFGTTLDGRITSDVPRDAENPFAKTIGNFCGLAGAIPDAIIRGTGLVQERTGTALDIFGEGFSGSRFSLGRNKKVIDEYVDLCHDHIDIRVVPSDRKRFGRVPVFADVAEKSGVALIGCDCGVDGDGIDNLKKIGAEIYAKYQLPVVTEVIDRVCAGMALRMIDICIEQKMVPENASIGFTGRAVISGKKPDYIVEGITEREIFSDPIDHLVFVDDGLARGAALMGRCMNSLGKPKNPLGGVRGGPCIMSKRIKIGR